MFAWRDRLDPNSDMVPAPSMRTVCLLRRRKSENRSRRAPSRADHPQQTAIHNSCIRKVERLDPVDPSPQTVRLRSHVALRRSDAQPVCAIPLSCRIANAILAPESALEFACLLGATMHNASSNSVRTALWQLEMCRVKFRWENEPQCDRRSSPRGSNRRAPVG